MQSDESDETVVHMDWRWIDFQTAYYESNYLWRHWYFTLPDMIRAHVRQYLGPPELWLLDQMNANRATPL